MVAAALVRVALLVEQLGQSAEDAFFSAGGLVDEGGEVADEEGEVDSVFVGGPDAPVEFAAVDGQFELFHGMVLGLERVILAVILFGLFFFAGRDRGSRGVVIAGWQGRFGGLKLSA